MRQDQEIDSIAVKIAKVVRIMETGAAGLLLKLADASSYTQLAYLS